MGATANLLLFFFSTDAFNQQFITDYFSLFWLGAK
jgi:hypothetical protein